MLNNWTPSSCKNKQAMISKEPIKQQLKPDGKAALSLIIKVITYTPVEHFSGAWELSKLLYDRSLQYPVSGVTGMQYMKNGKN